MDADLNHLFLEVGSRVPIAEQAQDLILAAAKWRGAGLEVVEATENREVQVAADHLPEAALFLRLEAAGPDRVPSFVQFALGIAAEHAKAKVTRLAPQVLHQSEQAIGLLHWFATRKRYPFKGVFVMSLEQRRDDFLRRDLNSLEGMGGWVETFVAT